MTRQARKHSTCTCFTVPLQRQGQMRGLSASSSPKHMRQVSGEPSGSTRASGAVSSAAAEYTGSGAHISTALAAGGAPASIRGTLLTYPPQIQSVLEDSAPREASSHRHQQSAPVQGGRKSVHHVQTQRNRPRPAGTPPVTNRVL
mmetsp:Transcript_15244/g.46022  ORF Transcript_15244/g.46022 Transcript_15244/m.46022 type:complete len:145 (+) Transcript_15244:2105-2539(+)